MEQIAANPTVAEARGELVRAFDGSNREQQVEAFMKICGYNRLEAEEAVAIAWGDIEGCIESTPPKSAPSLNRT
jgi:hypothetical protein